MIGRLAQRTVLAFALSTIACAPLVSRKSAGPYRPATALLNKSAPAPKHAMTERAEAQLVVKDAPKPIAAEEKPVAVIAPPPVASPQVAPARVERVEAKPVIEKKEAPEPAKPEASADPVYTAPEPAKKARTIGEFSDVEIGTLRKKSREFRKLHDQLKSCRTRSVRYVSKKIDCSSLESRVFTMLNETYGAVD